MYVYCCDEKVVHLRYTRDEGVLLKLYKTWFDMGHTPVILKEEVDEQAR